MVRRCEVCGREFEARRSTARFCSATCRSRAFRAHAFVGELEPPEPSASIGEDEVAGIVGRAHDVAQDMSRASMLTPAPLCLSLDRVAYAIESALRREGL